LLLKGANTLIIDQSKKVSVIIPNYNYAIFVGFAIESVLAQTYGNYEIIVVNNGSTDNSLPVLSKYIDRIVLVDQSNLGQSGARNSGILHSNGDLIAFLDADDFWEPTKLEKQVKLLSTDSQLVYCGLQQFENRTSAKTTIQIPQHRGDCRDLFWRQPGVGIVLGGESTVIITRELLGKVGKFDTRLNVSSGWDFYRRCASFTKFDYVPEILVNYRIHDNNMSKSASMNVQDIRKSFLIMSESLENSIKVGGLLFSFLKLELTFLKTFLCNRNWKYFLSSMLKLPLHFSQIIALRLGRYFS